MSSDCPEKSSRLFAVLGSRCYICTLMLPREFLPKYNYDLTRIGCGVGTANDGGYLVEKSSMENSKMLIGLGLDDNWQFEKQFTKNYQLPLVGFDNNLRFKFLARRLAARFFAVFRGRQVYTNFAALFQHVANMVDYFRCRKFFHRKFVGYSDSPTSTTFRSLVQNYVTETPFFVKCDIEGWEYRILNELVEYAPQISGAVIEFHDIDLHRERILEFIKNFPLTLVHSHPNNWTGVDKNQDPIMVEMSFAKDPAPINDLPCKLPHPLDRTCCLDRPDIFIG